MVTWSVGTQTNFVKNYYIVFFWKMVPKWSQYMYEYHMNIGLFGRNFNLILDKKSFNPIHHW